MKGYKNLAWLLLFGSLWGLNETVVGEAFYNANIPRASFWLSAFALLVLAMARGAFNKPGSSFLIGAIASLYRLTNAGPYLCHICGILFLGMAFDLAASLLVKQERKISLRLSLTGCLASYGSNTLFALVMTYIIRYKFWASAGLPKVLDHIFLSGSLQALAACIVVPLGVWIGLNGESLSRRKPSWAYGGVLLASILLWIVGGLSK